jgi:hypothetical protein
VRSSILAPCANADHWRVSVRFWRRMQELLPSKIVTDLRNRQKITVLEGDITKDNFGLIEQALTSLRKRIPIFVHAASSLSIRQGLPRMASIIVHPSVVAAQLALTFTHLERFVFVSTVYVNSFLYCDDALFWNLWLRACSCRCLWAAQYGCVCRHGQISSLVVAASWCAVVRRWYGSQKPVCSRQSVQGSRLLISLPRG